MGNKVDFTKHEGLMSNNFENEITFNKHKKVHKMENIVFPLSTLGSAIVDS